MRARYTWFALLFACAEGPGPAPSQPHDVPALDLALTEGNTAAEHVEVAPGVFLLREVAESGAVRYTPMEAPLVPGDELDPGFLEGQIVEGEKDPALLPGGSLDCYNYKTDYYSDSTRDGAQLDGRSSWYASLNAYSYDYKAGPMTYDTDSVYAYVYTYAAKPTDYVYAYAYVYIDGRYVGYVYQTAQNKQAAYAYGSWTPKCDSGTIEATVVTQHYLYQQVSLGTYPYTAYETLSVGDALTATVDCCP